ncbi:membrane protein [Streptomyces sp. NRRL B-3229]|uniref:membrane protein n=1 Tax=Streptomyces sp. NRRL B-3229 TaxID=1463836 RepID=UPI0004BE615B|nr:membrane protein [Streptomyces sp. NRRL B-3229]
MTTSLDRDTVDLPPLLPGVRRLLKHPRLMHYNRLAALVIAANLGFLYAGWAPTQVTMGRAALVNLAVAVLVRQQYVVNLFFRLATWPPTSWPLRIRWTLGKVYHFGGLHVGGALAGTAWFLALTTATPNSPRAAIGWTLIALLALIVATALPPFRSRHHDHFEKIHRFGGWAALALFWTHTLLAAPGPFEVTVLAVVTFSVALPWLRLRKVAVRLERPSPHVVLARFDHGETPFAGSSTAISRSPLKEWHSFANVPAPGEPGFRLTISRAGDWTGAFIDDLPPKVWVKGITTAGVANIETLFTKVVYVATGSGIGPCLPHLLAAEVPSRLVWATRDPRTTYGDALVDEILAVQPDALVWDTSRHGKPDMVSLAYEAYRDFGAEAVICISNKKLTWQVVHGLERRGIPAYGAIWDS